MSTLGRTRIRLAGDAACFDAPLDALRRATPQFWRGNDVQFEITAFFNGVLLDVSNLASLTLEIRPLGTGGAAPDPAFTPMMGTTVTEFDNTTTLDSWNSGTKQHAVITFTAAQSNIVAGGAWLSIFVVTTDSPGRVITLCAGPIRVLEDGAGLATTPTPAGDTFYTAAQSDARFAAIGDEGSGGGGIWGSITGTLSSQSDLNTVLNAKAPLASPTFTGTPTVPTPGGSDNSTKIATTAWVRGYTAGVTSDGSGHYVFGGGDPATLATGATALLTVNGGFSANSIDGCHLFTNSGATFDDVLHVMRTTTDSGHLNAASGIDFRPNPNLPSNSDTQVGSVFVGGHVTGAVGCLNVQDRSYCGLKCGATYLSGSPPFDATTLDQPTAGVGEVGLVQEGIYSSAYHFRAVIRGADDWSIVMQDPTGARIGGFLAPSNGGAVEFNIEGTSAYSGGSSGSGSAAQFSAKSSDGNYAVLASYNSAFSYHAYPASGAALLSTGSGGLMVGAVNGSGVITFLAGGDQASNEAFRVDSAKRLIFSNVVTSAPSGSLANSQYEFTVYDNSGTATLRVRYKDASGTVKTGDLALS